MDFTSLASRLTSDVERKGLSDENQVSGHVVLYPRERDCLCQLPQCILGLDRVNIMA